MSVHKAVVLARGLGTRMRRASDTSLTAEQARAADAGVKALVPIGRPFLDYVLSALADAGVRDVCLVIGPEHDVIRDYYTRGIELARVRVEFAVQAEPRGTADAVLAAEPWARRDPFLVLNSDNYYPPEAYAALAKLGGPGLPGFSRRGLLGSGMIRPDRIAAFALLDVAPDGSLRRIIEKPDTATLAAFGDNPLVSMNCWRFGPEVFDACRAVTPSPRGELELPMAVQVGIERLGLRLVVVPFDLPVLDLSTRDDISVVARALSATEVRL